MVMQSFTEKEQFTTYALGKWSTTNCQILSQDIRYPFTTFLDLGLEEARGLACSVVFPQSLPNGQRILSKMQRLKVNGK